MPGHHTTLSQQNRERRFGGHRDRNCPLTNQKISVLSRCAQMETGHQVFLSLVNTGDGDVGLKTFSLEQR